jgi:hypothetical protein
MRFSIHVLLAVALSAASASAFQSVHVVSGGAATALQDAINMSADGDTVLVHGGHYGAVIVNARSVGPSQRCVVAGLDVLSAGATPALTVQNCSGGVRFEGFRAQGLPTSSVDGATVDNCSNVAFVRCELQGGSQRPTPGPNPVIYPVGRGLVVNASQVALYDSSSTGGDGQDSHFINTVFASVPAGIGGAGVESAGGATVFAGHVTVTGGAGGKGRGLACVQLPCGLAPSAGGNGGPGVNAGGGTNVYLRDTQTAGGIGGIGGSGGQCCPQTTWPPGPNGMNGQPTTGPITTVPGTSTVLVAASVVRELHTLDLVVNGTPGDTVYLGTAVLTQWTLDLGLEGVFLFGPPSRRILVGTVPASGVLQVGLPVPALPPGVGAQNRFMQVVVRTPTGQTQLGSPETLTILDSIY